MQLAVDGGKTASSVEETPACRELMSVTVRVMPLLSVTLGLYGGDLVRMAVICHGLRGLLDWVVPVRRLNRTKEATCVVIRIIMAGSRLPNVGTSTVVVEAVTLELAGSLNEGDRGPSFQVKGLLMLGK